MTNYYAQLGLNPAAQPAAIGAEITTRLRTMPPGPERHLHEQARAVLADPAKRRIYDSRGPEQWTPEELHALAMAHTAPTVRDRVMAVVGTGTRRVLVLAVAALAALLLITVTAVSCSSDGSDTAAPSSGTDGQPEQSSSSTGDGCEPISNGKLSGAKWDRAESTGRVVVLQQKIDIPSPYPFGETLMKVPYGNTVSYYRGITQFQDKNIGVFQGPQDSGDTALTIVSSTDGRVISSTQYTTAELTRLPKGFDLAATPGYGYYRIAATDGVQIPAAATGTEANQVFAKLIMRDVFDDSVIWVVLRGEDRAIYKAKSLRAENVSDCLK